MTQVTTIKRRKLTPAKVRAEIRRKVVSLRQRLGVGGKPATRKATADALDVSVGSVYNWEHAGTTPHRHVVRKIDALLNAPRTAVVKADRPKASRAERPAPKATTAEQLAIMADAIARCGGVDGAKAALERVELALA